MTVSDITRRVVYVGDGSTSQFPFAFKVFGATQLAVYVSDGTTQTELTYGSDYSVTLEDDGTGTVALAEPLAAEHTIAIVSAVPQTQEMKLTNQGAFYPTVINESADKMTALIQQIDEKVGRAIRLPETSTQTTAEAYDELTTAARQANAALALMGETISAAEEMRQALEEVGDVTGAVPVAAAGTAETKTLSEWMSAVAGHSSAIAEQSAAIAEQSTTIAEQKDATDDALRLAGLPSPDTAVYPPTDCGGDLMNDVEGDPTRSLRTIQSPFVDRFDGILYVPQVVAATEATFMNAFVWSDDPTKRVRLARSPFWYDFLGHQSTFLYRPTKADPPLFLSRRNKVKSSGVENYIGAFDARLIAWDYNDPETEFSVLRTFTLFDSTNFSPETMMEIALSPDCKTLVARAIRSSDSARIVRVWRNFTEIVAGDVDDISASADIEYASELPKAAADQGIFTDGKYIYYCASSTLRITTIAGKIVSTVAVNYGEWLGELSEFDGAYSCGAELESIFFAPYRGKFETFAAVSTKKYSDIATFTRYDRYFALSLPSDLTRRYDSTAVAVQRVSLNGGMVDAAGNHTGAELSVSWSTILRGRSNNDTEGLSCGVITRYRTATTTGQGFGRGQIAVENVENAIASRIAIFGETRRADEITTSYVNPGISETTTLGTSSSLWAQLYAATSTIATSDEREKQDIGEIPDAVFRAWAKVEFVQFKFRSAVAKKGNAARTHIGVIAQRIKTAFESEGLNPFAYGLLCYDKWEYDPEEKTPAGDRYAVRYEECLALECAYQRWRLAKIEERLV